MGWLTGWLSQDWLAQRAGALDRLRPGAKYFMVKCQIAVCLALLTEVGSPQRQTEKLGCSRSDPPLRSRPPKLR